VILRIWCDDWEWQCCGGPVDLGSRVTWDLKPMEPQKGLNIIFGDEMSEVSHVETHHGPRETPDPFVPTTGTIVGIRAAYGQYFRPDRDTLTPVPESGVLESRESLTGWEDELGELEHVGYVVDLEV
jgi:hypothetical protein